MTETNVLLEEARHLFYSAKRVLAANDPAEPYPGAYRDFPVGPEAQKIRDWIEANAADLSANRDTLTPAETLAVREALR